MVTGLPHNRGKLHCIPRITFTAGDLPCDLERLQLPLKPAFALTINKSQAQGRTIESGKVGSCLPEPKMLSYDRFIT